MASPTSTPCDTLEAIPKLVFGAAQGAARGSRAIAGSLRRPEMARLGRPQQRCHVQSTAAGLLRLPLVTPNRKAGPNVVSALVFRNDAIANWGNGSWMRGDVHVRFWESAGVKCPAPLDSRLERGRRTYPR